MLNKCSAGRKSSEEAFLGTDSYQLSTRLAKSPESLRFSLLGPMNQRNFIAQTKNRWNGYMHCCPMEKEDANVLLQRELQRSEDSASWSEFVAADVLICVFLSLLHHAPFRTRYIRSLSMCTCVLLVVWSCNFFYLQEAQRFWCSAFYSLPLKCC